MSLCTAMYVNEWSRNIECKSKYYIQSILLIHGVLSFTGWVFCCLVIVKFCFVFFSFFFFFSSVCLVCCGSWCYQHHQIGSAWKWHFCHYSDGSCSILMSRARMVCCLSVCPSVLPSICLLQTQQVHHLSTDTASFDLLFLMVCV